VVIPAHQIRSYFQAMSETNAGPSRRSEAGQYEIRIRGHLEPRWVAWFEGLTLTREAEGTTLICGSVADQAALHGLLQKVRDVGLPLVSVRNVTTDSSSAPPPNLHN
jgi:hypothetical protein